MTGTVSHSPAGSACRFLSPQGPLQLLRSAALAVYHHTANFKRVPGALLLLVMVQPHPALELLTAPRWSGADRDGSRDSAGMAGCRRSREN